MRGDWGWYKGEGGYEKWFDDEVHGFGLVGWFFFECEYPGDLKLGSF